jgi:hypothetical protein
MMDLTATERAARVQALQNLTQDEYNHLFRIVRLVVPPYLCEASEALSAGLLAAARNYNGEARLSTYVARCALHHALRVGKQCPRTTVFTDLRTGERAGDNTVYLEETIGMEDPRYVEAIDDHLIARIYEILADLEDSRRCHVRPKVLALAAEILDLLHTNANLGKGVGIDEYDHAPPKAPEWKNQFKVEYNRLQPRTQINQNLARTLGANPSHVAQAMIALRQSTRQALREGWLGG